MDKQFFMDAVAKHQDMVYRIALHCYGQTPEKLASEEWQNFLSHYDVDSAASALGNNLSGYEEEYGMYQVCNQEMADKLDEILAKYDLKKHTEIILILSEEDLCTQVGGDQDPGSGIVF